MACGPNCANKWHPTLYPVQYPPKGGWGLTGIPPGTPVEVAQIADPGITWKANDGPNGWRAALDRVVRWLEDQQGVAVDAEIYEEILVWADAQWCAKDPGRCPKGAFSGNPTAGGLKSMHWARGFWMSWNAALSSEDVAFLPANEHFIQLATTLIRGKYGCGKCAKHWAFWLAEYPVEKADTLNKARVWLWQVHNATREGLRPTPYNTIAKRYGWREYSDSQLKDILKELTSSE